MPITPLPPPPTRQDPEATFVSKANAFLGALPTFATEANALEVAVDADAVAAAASASASAASAVTAGNAASVAVGAANYRGAYNAGTTYQIGQSVDFGGRRWVARTVNTGVTPVEGANWFAINDLPAPGTAGNILTSNGTTWTSAAPAPSSGTLQAVASGNLADGSTVVVNADGTVSVVSGVAQAVGSPVNYTNADTSNISATYDSNAQRVVIAYRNNALSGFGTAVVGTVSGTSITFGTPVTFRSAGCDFISATYDANAQRVVIAWRDQGGAGFAIVGTVSGTSISFGSLVNFYGNVTNNISATYHVAAGRVVIAFTDGSSVNEGLAIVGTVSGTSISFGSWAYFTGNSTGSVAATYDSNAQRIVIAYANTSNSGFGTAVVGNVSGTNISFGSTFVFRSAGISSTSATYDSNAQRVVIAYLVVNDGAVNVGTVSGTSITFGSPVTFQAGMSNNGTSIIYDGNAQRVVVFYQRSSDSLGVGIAGTVTGTSISFGLPTTLPTGSSGWSAVYHAAQQRPVVAYRPNNTGFGAAAVFTTGVTNLTTENFIGFSNGAYTNGQTATIQLVGSVDDAQSGLTPGRAYFVQTLGGIGLTPAIPSVFAGTAVAANRIIVKG